MLSVTASVSALTRNKSSLQGYFKSLEEKKKIEKEYKELEDRLGQKDNEIETLNSQRNQITIALELINKYLAYIFFDNNHLCLENKNGKYQLKVNG